MHADEILVLENGRVVERGRHADLLAQGGQYAIMWRRQLESDDRALPLPAREPALVGAAGRD
jgi:ATP-binding cassette subfamily B protein